MERILGAIIKAFLEAFFGAVRDKRRDLEHDTALTDRAVSEQARKALEKSAAIQKEMADAQARAPGNRSDLIDRLRAEAAAEAGADGTGADLPVVDGRSEGAESQTGG